VLNLRFTTTSQAHLAAARAEIHKLQQGNASFRKQLALKPSTTDIPCYPSECTVPSLLSHLSVPLLRLRLLSLNAMLLNLTWLLLPSNSLHLLKQQAINSSMYLFNVTSLYNKCALTFTDYISIIRIKTWSAFLSTLVMKLCFVHSWANSTPQSVTISILWIPQSFAPLKLIKFFRHA
jgi:hypothetical protein